MEYIYLSVSGSQTNDSIYLPANTKVINFYTSILDDLTIIAKYRLLPVPTFLAIDNGKVIARILNISSVPQIIRQLGDNENVISAKG